MTRRNAVKPTTIITKPETEEIAKVIFGELRFAVVKGAAVEILAHVPDDIFDAIVMDPPYGFGPRDPTLDEIIAYLTAGAELDTGGDFMGKKWKLLSVATWREILRVAKPGAHLLCNAGTRMFDLVSLGIRAAGWEQRDTIADEDGALRWLHGQGWPKGGDLGVAIDKSLKAVRPVIGERVLTGSAAVSTAEKGGTYAVRAGSATKTVTITAPATPEAEAHTGQGSQLKPAWEPILVFRKPFKGSLVRNVLTHGTGALNVDACRIGTGGDKGDWPVTDRAEGRAPAFGDGSAVPTDQTKGRWPANVVMVHAPQCRVVGTRVVKRAIVVSVGGAGSVYREGAGGSMRAPDESETLPVFSCAPGCPVAELDRQSPPIGDGPPPSAFFYCAKASTSEKDAGLPAGTENRHPTVKPIELGRWLVRLVTPPGGVVLDATCGSGSYGAAAVLEQRRYVGIDLDPENEGHVDTARARVAFWDQDRDAVQGKLFG